MKPIRIVYALSLGALILAGCGKSSSSESLDLKSFAAQAAAEYCAAQVKCSCTDASALQDCETAYGKLLTQELSQVIVQNPAYKIDPAAAQVCLDDVKAALAECSYPVNSDDTLVGALVGKPKGGFIVPSCDLIFVGTQEAGEHCSNDSDCAAELACDRSDYTCAARPGLDGDCNSVSCQDAFFCLEGACAPLPGADAACPDYYCQEGLSCVDVSGAGQYQCTAPHPEGASCSDGAGCEAGTRCDWGSTTTCVALLADGAECTYYYECTHLSCDAGICADPGICNLLGYKD